VNKSAIRIRIRQICCLGLGEELLATALVPAVRELVASDSGAFAWLDRSGELTNVYSDRLSSMQMVAAMPVLGSRARVPRGPIQNIDADTRWGHNRVLTAVLRDSVGELAQVSLCRPGSATPFGSDEIAELSSVTHYIAHGMGRGRKPDAMHGLEFSDSPEEALVIADRGGVIRYATEEGRRMLLLAAGRKIDRVALSSVGSIVSDLLRDVCAKVDAAEAGGRACALSATTSTSWGRFVLTAYPLLDGGAMAGNLVGIRVLRQEPAIIPVVRAISRLELSPQQSQIALLIAQGQSNREIAASMRVSCNTVAYHVRQLFMKLGVHDRASLMARIHRSPATPSCGLSYAACENFLPSPVSSRRHQPSPPRP